LAATICSRQSGDRMGQMASQTQRSRVADELLAAIKDGRFPVGSKLPSERLLAEEYGVSRPVVREALGMLITLDVIDVQMGRGAYVTSADVTQTQAASDYSLIDVVDAREVIESGAIRLAVLRAGDPERKAVRKAISDLDDAVARGQDTSDLDLALHFSLVQAARSSLLTKLWNDMTEEIVQTIRISPHGRSMSREILTEHQQLADGVLEGNLDLALEACGSLYDDHRQFLHSLLS
jgi:GntR family transcriptional repressor for pyruvate dehydrogenase complex